MKFVGPSWVSATPQELAWGHWVLSKWPSGHNPPSTLSYSSVLWWKDQSMLVRIAFFVSLHLQSWMSATPQAASLGPINKLRVLGVVCSVSCVQYPVFSIQYSVFSIQCPVFIIQYSVFSIQYSVSSVIIYPWGITPQRLMVSHPKQHLLQLRTLMEYGLLVSCFKLGDAAR